MRALHELTASEIALAIRTGQVSSREVVEQHLMRAAALNPKLNALGAVLAEQALAEADRADRRRRDVRDQGELPPLLGVPFTAKENLDCLGSATTHGLTSLADQLPFLEAPAVARMRSAGAILVGRGNMSELGLRLCGDSPLRGRTLNPHDPLRTCGGSSGGDAVAVSVGMVPVALGSDLGGSLRVPAHCCGVSTLKPTTGRIPFASSLPPHDYGFSGQAMIAVGPLARSVTDLELCLRVLHGRDCRDPRSVDAPLSGPAPRERIAALVTDLPGVQLTECERLAIERAGNALQEEGWVLENTAPPEVERVCELWHKLVALDLSVVIQQLQNQLSSSLYQHVLRVCGKARLEQTSQYRLHEERSRLLRAWSGFFSEYPVVVGPTMSCPPWTLDADLDPVHGLDLLDRATRFVLPASALGLPTVSLPMGFDQQGLPLSVQVYADLWREDLALEAARIVERCQLGHTGSAA